MRTFEYCTLSAERNFKERNYPWGAWHLTRDGDTTELEVTAGGSAPLNVMGRDGWELVGPPIIDRFSGGVKAFDHNKTLRNTDHWLDVAAQFRITYYFKRELDQ